MFDRRQSLLILIAALSLGAVGVALVSQYVFDMPPCAWCVLQRMIYLTIAVVSIVGALTPRAASAVAAGLATLLAVSGIAAAWYQHTVASQMLSCDQTFADRFVSGTGLDAAVPALFGIFATCMDAMVQVMGLEYAVWSLILFAILTIVGIAALRAKPAGLSAEEARKRASLRARR